MATASEVRLARVLVIDDDATVGRVLVRLLESECDVSAVTSATEAIDRLQSGERFDVIFCDLRMPLVDGVQFHQALLQSNSDHADRVIFMTGAAPSDMLAYVRALPNPCLDKPFNMPQVLELVRARSAGDVGAPRR